MVEKQLPQLSMLEADNLYENLVVGDAFYGFLAALRGRIFSSDQFVDLYRSDRERPGAPPSLLATALLLQCHDLVPDERARDLANYDLRWKYPLGIRLDDQPFNINELLSFRRQIVRLSEIRARFQPSLDFALEQAQPKIQSIKTVHRHTSALLDQATIKGMYDRLGHDIAMMIDMLEQGMWFAKVDQH
ncbi:MAG: transposase [Dehalococcoidia bacterium]|nr:transposase [Dehalococcoidia bacterium]